MTKEKIYTDHFEKIYRYAYNLLRNEEKTYCYISQAVNTALLSGIGIERSEKDWLSEILKLLRSIIAVKVSNN